MMIVQKGSELHITGEYKGKDYTPELPYVIDLKPVEEFTSLLEGMIQGEDARKGRLLAQGKKNLLEKAEEMSGGQKQYVIDRLLGHLQVWTELYQSALDDPNRFAECVRQHRAVMKSGESLYNMIKELGSPKEILQSLQDREKV